jgi:L-ascorbate metabolism protein UlaG (beta-lactamase superfamily)
MLKPAFQKDNDLLNDIEAARNQPDKLHIWWLGQSGFLLQYNGKHLLFDPYLSDSLSEKYMYTDKPHVRISEQVIFSGHLGMVDVVTSSHNHTDHLDYNTLMPLFAANWDMKFVIAEANRQVVINRVGDNFGRVELVGLTDGQTKTINGFVFHGVPAAHNELERDAEGRPKFMGFVVEIGPGHERPYKVYHSGDTLWYEGMTDILRPFEVDVAFLPINGNKPERRVAGNLDPDEAARLGREIGAKLVIPHHYDLFEFNTADPADFVQACEQYGTPYRIMQLGEGITL